MRDIGIVVCLHGNEHIGLEVNKKLNIGLPIFIANPLAVKNNVRFIDSDMNRSFPGKIDGNYEERQAYHLLKQIKKFKHVIDVHSSSCKIELFGIITKPNAEKLHLAKKMGIKKVVLMNEIFAKGTSMIDNLDCAISLEVGPHNRKENLSEVIDLIKNLKNNLNKDCSNFKLEIFEVTKILFGENISKFYIENFKEVKKGDLIAESDKKHYAQFDFFPIFVGEDAYKGIICMATKKIN